MLDKIKSDTYWCSVETIDPDTAATILESNTLNRDIGPVLVKRMAEDMVAGRWLTNGDSIKFDRTGKLVDGQHRLSAVVDSQTTLETFVCGGLAPEIFATLDVGKKRSLKDAMKIHGVPNYIVASNTVPWIVRLSSTDPVHNRSHGMKPADLLDYYTERADGIQHAIRSFNRTKYATDPTTGRADPNLRATAPDDTGKRTTQRSFIMAPMGLISGLAYKFGEIDQSRADDFIRYWGQASVHPDLAGTSPLAKLADALADREAQMARIGGRVHDADRMLMAVHTWNAFIRREKLTARTLHDCNVRHPSKPSKWPGILGPKIDAPGLDLDGESDDLD